ncbi:MAG: ATP-dependent DNA helicase RecG [Syntrophomonadaceae bacterium]|nr:ATP-dependent DNA helicase RecG [Syntrophomonadaceae bacterium]
MNIFNDSVQFLKGVGPQRAERLRKLGVRVCFDLFWLFPHSYFNRSNVSAIADIRDDGELYHIKGSIVSARSTAGRRGHQLFRAWVRDDSGDVEAIWFNQPYLANSLKPGMELLLSGKLRSDPGRAGFTVSDYTVWHQSEEKHAVLPVYPLTAGLNQKWLRGLMLRFLQEHGADYPELLSAELKAQYGLCDIEYALREFHFPTDREGWKAARRRLVVEELMLYRLGIAAAHTAANAGFVRHPADSALRHQVLASLPYKLTAGQEQALREILEDMSAARKMNRLLQGDVGAGKTVVAALAMAQAVGNGYQAALMAPTEILAGQHYRSLSEFFAGCACEVACLTGGTPAAERRRILQASESGELDILVGTHALIGEKLSFNNLGLIVIDEQHRFGVRQRALLDRKGAQPDNLVMTATPIPRSLALTFYAHLELSAIRELPPHRKPVKTTFVSFEESEKAYDFLERRLREGRQAYIVCPLVEESEQQDLQDAIGLYEALSHNRFKKYRPELIHGRMNPAEKGAAMQAFAGGQCRLLISTTVIEVGVDVPNAGVILIYHAERFGLSQLHQLRGRVGRGSEQSYCILLGEAKSAEARQRLRAMEQCHDGFELANIDLRLRGPGDFWGVRQHGLNEFRLARLEKDTAELNIAVALSDNPQALSLPAPELNRYIKARFPDGDEIANN